jgi:hypothetical protein
MWLVSDIPGDILALLIATFGSFIALTNLVWLFLIRYRLFNLLDFRCGNLGFRSSQYLALLFALT